MKMNWNGLAFGVLATLSFSMAKAENIKIVPVDGHPESVVCVPEGVYFTSIGQKLEPMAYDKDGYIGFISKDTMKPIKISKGELDAPKGIIFEEGKLFCADISRIVEIDPKSGEVKTLADMKSLGVKFLNDLAYYNGRIFVTATDLNKIFVVSIKTGEFMEVPVKGKIVTPNGIVLDTKKKKVYVCEYDEKGGRVVEISDKDGSVKQIGTLTGSFDGLAVDGEKLYVSDWTQAGKPEAIREISLAEKDFGSAKGIAKAKYEGAADFVVNPNEKGQLVVPNMVKKEIIFETMAGE